MTDQNPKSLPLKTAIPWQTATITRITPASQRISSFWFRPNKPFAYRAGQHVDVRVTKADGSLGKRSYSIASAPESGDEIELAIERLDGGEVSAFFHQQASVGDTVELRGPLGSRFAWSVEQGGPLLLIGGGSGAVPLISMLRHRIAQESSVPALLFYSARSWDEVVFRDELLAMHDKRDGIELAFALTREPARRPVDFSRRIDMPIITDLLRRLPANPALAYVCGSDPFVEAAAQGLIDAGMPPVLIRTERFGA